MKFKCATRLKEFRSMIFKFNSTLGLEESGSMIYSLIEQQT